MVAVHDDVVFEFGSVVGESLLVIANHSMSEYLPVGSTDLNNVAGVKVVLVFCDARSEQALAALKYGSHRTGIDCNRAMGVILYGDPAFM